MFTGQANEGYNKYMKQLTNIASSQQLVTKIVLEVTIKVLLIVELDRV